MKPKEIKAAYEFLKVTAFFDQKLPKRIRIVQKPLKKAWAYYTNIPPTIELDERINTGTRLLKVLAHEMTHAALAESGAHGKADHGVEFKTLAEIVCERMGWPQKGL